MVKKILNEILAELDTDSKVAIGTEKGGAFIYIGTVEGAFNDLHKLFDNDLKRQKYYMSQEFDILNKYSFITPEDEDAIRYCKFISDHYRRYKVFRDRIDGFENPMTRQVKNMYQKEDGSLAIIIAGRERGQIWMEDEYNDPLININLKDSYYMEQARKENII